MKIFVDENIPNMTVEKLCQMGHDVMDIRGTEKEGLSDRGIWEIVQEEERLLITTDKGFVYHRDDKHQGIIIVRLKKPNRKKIHSRILQALLEFKESEWKGLTVIMRDNVQIIWRSSEEGLFQ
jgi:predicted nuclease of predicted toxin-antitoxin system